MLTDGREEWEKKSMGEEAAFNEATLRVRAQRSASERRNDQPAEESAEEPTEALSAVELRERFRLAVAAAGSSMEVGLDRGSFKALVAALLASDKPPDTDLDAAFTLADDDKSGKVDVFEFIKLFTLVADGTVKGLGKKKSLFWSSAKKKQHADFKARLALSSLPFRPGDQVAWKGADDDLSAGAVGTVLCVHDDASGDVEVLFYSTAAGAEATFTFGVDRLVAVREAKALVPAENNEARAARKRVALARLAVVAKKSEARATQAKVKGAAKARKVILERQSKAEREVAAKAAKEAVERDKAAKREAEKLLKRRAEVQRMESASNQPTASPESASQPWVRRALPLPVSIGVATARGPGPRERAKSIGSSIGSISSGSSICGKNSSESEDEASGEEKLGEEGGDLGPTGKDLGLNGGELEAHVSLCRFSLISFLSC
jgi:hypothetical protein